MLASRLKASGKFPNFITGSYIINASSKLEKVFPKIGLPNFKDDVSLKLDFTDLQLDKAVHLAISQWLAKWRESAKNVLSTLKGIEIHKMGYVLYLMEELNRRFLHKAGIKTQDKQVVLTANIQSFDGTILAKTGTDCFVLVQALLDYSANYVQIDLVSPVEMEKQCRNLQVVFRSNDLEGAWDIATMSMRGIKSCMRWEARQSTALVGSIVDPGCGIIYITNGTKTPFGTKMLFRALVRLGINLDTDQPVFLIDRVYSSFYKNRPDEVGKFDREIKELFVQTLKSKLPDATIIDAQGSNVRNDYALPKFDNLDVLLPGELSYQDSQLTYGGKSYKNLMPDLLKRFKGKTPKKGKR